VLRLQSTRPGSEFHIASIEFRPFKLNALSPSRKAASGPALGMIFDHPENFVTYTHRVIDFRGQCTGAPHPHPVRQPQQDRPDPAVCL
jgi:hypothetical protein